MSVIPLQVPDIGTPLFDLRTGVMNPVWVQYFQILVLRTGGESGTDDGDFEAEIIVLQNRATDAEGSGASFVPVQRPPTEQMPQEACIFPIAQDADPGPVNVHGLQYDPSLHAIATPVDAGFMSAADKAKLDSIAGGASCFMVYQNAAQAVTTGFSNITFNTVLFDDTGEYSIGSNAFIPANSGTYTFSAGVAGSQGTVTRRLVCIYVNGVLRVTLQDSNGNNGGCTIAGNSGPMKLAAGDLVRCVYFTNIADTTAPAQTQTYFSGWRIK
jgi:hypothetical protein